MLESKDIETYGHFIGLQNKFKRTDLSLYKKFILMETSLFTSFKNALVKIFSPNISSPAQEEMPSDVIKSIKEGIYFEKNRHKNELINKDNIINDLNLEIKEKDAQMNSLRVKIVNMERKLVSYNM